MENSFFKQAAKQGTGTTTLTALCLAPGRFCCAQARVVSYQKHFHPRSYSGARGFLLITCLEAATSTRQFLSARPTTARLCGAAAPGEGARGNYQSATSSRTNPLSLPRLVPLAGCCSSLGFPPGGQQPSAQHLAGTATGFISFASCKSENEPFGKGTRKAFAPGK